ncbi:MAG: DUF4339 domain-containing protein [Deltaproteobacteria bacterium]|nr:DUF4339 domain-containing protein [Deltaproteobacteria bacterium]
MSENNFSNGNSHLNADAKDFTETRIQWFIGINGQQHGPITKEQLLELVYQKQLGPQDYVWREGMESWAHIQDVLELSAETEEPRSAYGELPLSHASDEPGEPLQQPEALYSSPAQDESDSNPDTHSVEVALGEDSARFGLSDTLSVEPRNGELSVDREQAPEAEGQSEHVTTADQATLQSRTQEQSVAQDSEDAREEIRGEASIAEDPVAADQAGKVEVPQNSTFATTNALKPLDAAYSLSNLVSNSRQTRSTQATRAPDGCGTEENSGLIDLGELYKSQDGITPKPGHGRVETRFRQKLDSLTPMERVVASERNRPVKLATAAAAGVIGIAAAAAFLILNYKPPRQDPILSTSSIADVSQRDLKNPPVEREGDRAESQPPKAASSSAMPGVGALSATKERVSAQPEIAGVKKSSRAAAATDGLAARKRAKPDAEKEILKKQSPTAASSTAKDNPDISTDELLDWAIGKGDKAPTPAAVKETSSSTPAAKPENKQPEQPTRQDTLAALRKVTPAVKACRGGGGGVATAAITVEGSSGKVTQVTISGVDAEIHECMIKAISRASFPRFSKERFDIKFPFRL